MIDTWIGVHADRLDCILDCDDDGGTTIRFPERGFGLLSFLVSKKIQMICASGDGGDDVIIIHNQKGKRDLH